MVYNLSIVKIVKGYQMHLFILFFFLNLSCFSQKLLELESCFATGFLCVPKWFGTKKAGFHFFLFTYNLPH